MLKLLLTVCLLDTGVEHSMSKIAFEMHNDLIFSMLYLSLSNRLGVIDVV